MGEHFMTEKLNFIQLLFNDLLRNTKIHIKNKEKAEKAGLYYGENLGNKNCGKTALKRKITYLRQELLNLERMLDDD